MTCYLGLTVIDLVTGLPIDIDVPFGTNKSNWGGVVEESGVPLHSMCSEKDKASIDGVRGFWTDDLAVFTRFFRYCMENRLLCQNMPYTEDEFQVFYSLWIDRKLRFVLEMI